MDVKVGGPQRAGATGHFYSEIEMVGSGTVINGDVFDVRGLFK